MIMDSKNRKAILKGLVMILSLAGVVYLLRVTGLDHMMDKHWMDEHVRGQGIWGVTAFVVLAGTLTTVGLPRQIVCFLAGYAFGLWGGLGAGLAASMLGVVLSFYYARFMGQSWVQRRIGRRLSRINSALERSPFSMTLVIRFLPVGSNLLTNLVAGVSRVPAWPFFAGSFLGHIPQSLVFALLGSGVRVDMGVRTAMSVALFVVSSLLGYLLYRRYKMEKVVAQGDGADIMD